MSRKSTECSCPQPHARSRTSSGDTSARGERPVRLCCSYTQTDTQTQINEQLHVHTRKQTGTRACLQWVCVCVCVCVYICVQHDNKHNYRIAPQPQPKCVRRQPPSPPLPEARPTSPPARHSGSKKPEFQSYLEYEGRACSITCADVGLVMGVELVSAERASGVDL
jgi:hypothetical protein